jgi:glycine dehydrogenase subunit 2
MQEKLIFEHSTPGRSAAAQFPADAATARIPDRLRRRTRAQLPEVSELQAVRHFTRLSQLNFSIDTHFYPLGSCTMKYNPRACNQYAMLPELLGRHPLAPESTGQGLLECLYELQQMLQEVTGMRAVSLTPMAGAQGEFAGVAMIRRTTARAATSRASRSSCPTRRTARTLQRRRCAAARFARSRRCRTATSTSTRCEPRWVRRRPASC